ncbi:MAG: DUF2148 domain-containing protein [Clostridiales bacterium]|nr:DUF2148 domain-containing protein [Clostridiales bacterium]
MIRDCFDAEMATIKQAADRMMTAAKTAPKASGVDDVTALALAGDEKDELADEMRRIGRLDERLSFFIRDAGNVDASPVVVLFGAKDIRFGIGEACQLCGFENCTANADGADFADGGLCALPVTDLGIALGSAVTVAQEMRVDNRIMFSVGKAALNLGFFGEDVRVAYGVPLYTGSKSIFRDRK